MDAIGNEKKKLGKSEICNLRKRNPINRRISSPLPTIPKDSKNNTKKNQSSNQGSSSSNSEKKNHNLSDKLSKYGKLTQAKRTHRFNNNLCLFCGGVGHTAKECPKSSFSVMKAKARAAQTKSDSAPVAEDTKKA